MKAMTYFTCLIWGIFVFILIGIFLFLFTSAHPSEIKIVALGDSITYGTGDPLKKGYIIRFKVQFEEYKETSVRLSNYGVPKYTTNQLLIKLKDKKIKKEIQQSNYIILYIGTNDFRKSAQYKFNEIDLKQINEGRIVFTNNLHKILKMIRKENSFSPIIVLGLYHPYVEYQNQQQLLGLINDWNMSITNVVNQYENISFVPTLDLYLNLPKKNYFSDSIHLNPAGYQLMANRLFTKMIVVEKKRK